MSPEKLDVLRHMAENIDTGLDSPETSRALVVFNETDEAQGGMAIYHAEMSWRRGATLPPIAVTQMDGRDVPSVVGAVQRSDDLKGRPDRELIAFDIRFAVTDVVPNGWKTYLAWFTDRALPENIFEEFLEPAPGLVVIETTRHSGDFAACGTF